VAVCALLSISERLWEPSGEISLMVADVRFSNRPLGVKHFQTIHVCGVGVAHGLVLLFGIGTKALPVWDSKTRRNNLWGGLAVLQTVAALAQSLPERGHKRCIRASRGAAEKADHRHPLLLRTRRKRPRDCRAGKKGDESATLHVRPNNQETAY
jgi:hypothetical protein